MNETKRTRLLANATVQARKIYGCVPADNEQALSPGAVRHVLEQRGTRMSFDEVRGCLKWLVETGLVKQLPGEYYLRTAVRPTAKKTATSEALDKAVTLAVETTNPNQEESAMPAQPVFPTPPMPANPLLPKTLAQRVRNLGDMLRELATECTQLAVDIEKEVSDSAEKAKKFEAIREMLKGGV